MGLGGLNEGVSRDSSQLKEAFSGEVNGLQCDTLVVPSVTVVPPPPWVPLLAWKTDSQILILGQRMDYRIQRVVGENVKKGL